MAYFNLNEAYRILGIEPGSDIKEVKKAYASLIKQYHPEENPEEWRKIHDAYTFLSKFLNAGTKSNGTETVSTFKTDLTGFGGSEFAGLSKEEDEEQILFDNLLDEAEKESGAFVFGREEDAERDREYFSEIMELVEKLPDSNIVIYGKPVIKVEPFLALRDNEKYEQAMRYPEFIKRLSEILGKSCPDPDIRSYLEGDVKKILGSGLDSPLRSEYPKLLKAAVSSTSKDAFMANVALEEAKKSGKYSKRNNRSASGWGLGILVAIMFFLRLFSHMHTQSTQPQFTPPTIDVSQMELPVPVMTVINAENADIETILADYEEFLDECRVFFGKYDIEDADDPDVEAEYSSLLNKKMQILLYELSYSPDLNTEEGRDIDFKLKSYHKEMEEIWEDWTPEDSETTSP